MKEGRDVPTRSDTIVGGSLAAVLFDMDGVVTDTAQAHAAAWKRAFDAFFEARATRLGESFRPFDPEEEYRKHVDGKPRLDGIRSVLQARAIDLPDGNAGDGPEQETVRGLARCKNDHFLAWLDEQAVQPWPGTLRLVAALRKAGIRTAVFSASRNAEAVLRRAGVHELFDARVDGNDLATLGLPGKPDPAMLREAAARLGTAPEHTAVVEDALAGVEAAVLGGFGLVIGVARGAGGDALRAAGADLVVRDVGELQLSPEMGLAVKMLAGLPLVRDRADEIRQRVSGRVGAVFLDYDGTLTPIVADHTRAILSEDMRAAVAALGARCMVAVVSGRDLVMLQRLVGVDGLCYAGSHGFEIVTPDGSVERLERGVEFLPELDDAEAELRRALAHIEGHAVERKRFSVAVHYRRVASERDVDALRSVVDRILSGHPRLRIGYGKKVLEIQPGIDWNKGKAVLWILGRLALDRPDVIPVYVGDDITDEDAFQRLAGRGLTVAVRDDESRPTAADYAVMGTAEVKDFVEILAAGLADTSVGAG